MAWRGIADASDGREQQRHQAEGGNEIVTAWHQHKEKSRRKAKSGGGGVAGGARLCQQHQRGEGSIINISRRRSGDDISWQNKNKKISIEKKKAGENKQICAAQQQLYGYRQMKKLK